MPELTDLPSLSPRLARRAWLRLLALGGVSAGFGLPGALPAVLFGGQPAVSNGSRTPGVRRVKSVIVVLASGGQSQIDLWDPKPLAPREIRGEFDSIATSVPGTRLGEHLPRLAALAHKYTLIRSMSHRDLDHGSAVYLTLTGQYHQRITSNPPVRSTDLPALQSIYKRLKPGAGSIDQAILLNGPAIVAPNDIAPGQFGGLLGREYDPLFVGDVRQDEVAIPGLIPLSGLPQSRVQSRAGLLAALEQNPGGPHIQELQDFAGQYRRALDLIQNPRTQRAFHLAAEPAAVRDRYGHSRGGQACLLARRLVEAEVPFVTVVWNHLSRGQDDAPDEDEAYGWDTHNDIFTSLRERLLPRFDQSLSALIADLDERGLLDETLVICLGEFGRAPLVALEPNFKGATPGRKHWAAAYSLLMAGGGTAAGKVVGKTDRHGGWPASESYGPWDIAATLFAALGVDPAGHYLDPLERPYSISTGKPILAAYAG